MAALAAYDFGSFFKAARAELHMSQEQFGHLVDLGQSRVCKVENGGQRLRDIATVARLASILRTPADRLGFTADLDTLEWDDTDRVVSWMQRRDFIATVTAIALAAAGGTPVHDRLNALLPGTDMDLPSRLGMADVEQIEATTAVFRDWRYQGAVGLSRPAIDAQLRWVIALGRNAVAASDAVRRRLLVATSDLAAVAGSINYDAERHEEARRLWLIALSAAREAGKTDLVSSILLRMGGQALHIRRSDEALSLLRLAYAAAADGDPTTSELALSEISAYQATSHAGGGRVQPHLRAVSKAEEHFANACEYEIPPWRRHFDDAELTAIRGHSYYVLARKVPAAAAQAEPLLRDAIGRFHTEHALGRTLNMVSLSGTYLLRGDEIEEGVRVGCAALDAAGTLNTPRVRSRLHELDRVTVAYAEEPVVADFRDRLRLALAGTA
ncbi:MAG: hypothetical protein V7603_4590 [Micromonosporaceae bacterium]